MDQGSSIAGTKIKKAPTCLVGAYFYKTEPITRIPILLLYISSNWEIGRGFSPMPASMVYPGFLYCCKNQSLYPAKLELYGTSANVYPLKLAKIFPISSASSGA